MRLYKYAIWLSVGFCAGCGIDTGYSTAPFGQPTYGYAQPGIAYAPDYGTAVPSPYGYAPAYGYDSPYGYAPAYGYTAPYQPAPSYGLGLGFFGGGHRDRDWRERGEWRDHEHFDRGDGRFRQAPQASFNPAPNMGNRSTTSQSGPGSPLGNLGFRPSAPPPVAAVPPPAAQFGSGSPLGNLGFRPNRN
jgi:hypothetical protein